MSQIRTGQQEGGQSDIMNTIFSEFPRFLVKRMIEYKDLTFSDGDIDDFIAIMEEKYRLTEDDIEELKDKLYDYIGELSDKLEKELGLRIISIYGADYDNFFIVPKEIADNDKLSDAIITLVGFTHEETESIINLCELASYYLSSCGLDATAPKSSHGKALAIVEIARAWGVKFDVDDSGYDKYSYTGVIRLCIDDQCIKVDIYYCNYVCNTHGVFKCYDYEFEEEEEEHEEEQEKAQVDIVKAFRSGNSSVVAIPVKEGTHLKRIKYPDGRVCYEPIEG